MKKNKILLSLFFIFILVFSLSFTKVFANSDITCDIQVTNSTIRCGKREGVKFIGSVASNLIKENNKYGIVLGYGKTSDLDALKLNGEVNEKNVINGEVSELKEDNTYSVTLTKIPSSAYSVNVSARAYIKEGDKVTYSDKIYITSLIDTTLSLSSEDEKLVEFKNNITSNYVLKTTNAFGNLLITPTFNEINYNNLRIIFNEDYKNLFNKDIASLNALEFFTELRSKNFYDISESNLYKFFNDESLKEKWGFLINYFESTDEIKTLYHTACAISSDGTFQNRNLHCGEELIYSLYNFFNGTDCESQFKALDFTSKVRYLDIVENCPIMASTKYNEYLKIGEEITLTAPKEIKEGYIFKDYNDGINTYKEGDKYKVIENEIEFTPEFDLKTYNIKYVNGPSIVTFDKNTFTIEDETFDLPILSLNNYSFEGWYLNKELIGTKIEKIEKGTCENITLYAKMVELGSRLEDTVAKVNEYMDKITLVESNLDLPTIYDEFLTTISWDSSNPKIIDSTGKLARDYVPSKVTLTANIHVGEDVHKYTYEVNVAGFKKLENIASGYIYSNYNRVTPLLFDTLDIINCAFVGANKDAKLSGTTFFDNCTKYIIDKAHEQGVYVVMSVAPNAEYAHISNPENKLVNKFADNIVRTINKYGFDGIDIDWEHPNGGQEQWFTNMMEAIYRKVKLNNKHHLVTAAIYGGRWQPPYYNLKESQHHMDYINLMCYGMTNTKGYYQNALYPSYSYKDQENKVGASQPSCSIKESVDDYYNLYGVPASMLIPGFAFYGIVHKREFKDGSFTPWVYDYSTSYTNIIETYLSDSKYEVVYDEKACVPYIINKAKTTFITYDNPRSIKDKCDYVKNNNLAGIMYWQNGQDTTDTLLNALKEGLNK